MIRRNVICDHCGKNLNGDRPYRLTLQRPSQHTYADYWNNPHVRQTYETEKTFHLCRKCHTLLYDFLNLANQTNTDTDYIACDGRCLNCDSFDPIAGCPKEAQTNGT